MYRRSFLAVSICVAMTDVLTRLLLRINQHGKSIAWRTRAEIPTPALLVI